eukprot:TRINITY_DN21117_c0_g1_i2.p1 TRINITY_DN21117_c0_g1~~TRINITY_DN21117_c0_g1_i2.p1  ORF type:complete len:103 (-),score=15.39 TRINITY_DN21117_c0_g1_i2:75-383(-)
MATYQTKANSEYQRVLQEFFEQGDLEKRHNYPVMPFMDKTKVVPPAEQIFFVSTFSLPLYDSLAVFFPRVKTVVDNHKMRLEAYKKELALLKESKAAEAKAA